MQNFFPTEINIPEFFSVVDQFLLKSNPKVQKLADMGDFQTPQDLCDQICTILYDRNICPQILIEPTCGEGNFIFAALRTFPSIQTIYAIELQPQYEWILKLGYGNCRKLSPFKQK